MLLCQPAGQLLARQQHVVCHEQLLEQTYMIQRAKLSTLQWLGHSCPEGLSSSCCTQIDHIVALNHEKAHALLLKAMHPQCLLVECVALA